MGGAQGNEARRLGLGGIIGQKDAIAGLREVIARARTRRELLDHILLVGNFGTGKATVARAIAAECGVELTVPSSEDRGHPGRLFLFLDMLTAGQLVLIEAMDTLRGQIRDIVVACMKQTAIQLAHGAGDDAATVSKVLPQVTIIATAREATEQLQNLFGVDFVFNLKPYENPELQEFVIRKAAQAGVSLSGRTAKLIVGCSKGTPGDVNAILKRVLLRAAPKGGHQISESEARKALRSLGCPKVLS